MVDRADFHLIAITSAFPVKDEAKKIVSLLDAGFHRVHLRHPSASRREIRDIIEAIPLSLHQKLVLHGHFDLACEFNLGGLHLNHRCPAPPSFFNGPLSRSCHSIAEVEAEEGKGMQYVTLSPIFDSISKHGYKAAFPEEVLLSITRFKTPVIALGGVTFSEIKKLLKYNFSGAAMLGALDWEADLDDFTRNCQNGLQSC